LDGISREFAGRFLPQDSILEDWFGFAKERTDRQPMLLLLRRDVCPRLPVRVVLPHGMRRLGRELNFAVKDLSSKLGVKNQNVHVWFGSTGKKLKGLKRGAVSRRKHAGK